jgi:hypothetical protein
MSKFTKARNALTTRILEGAGKAPLAQRRAAFENAGLAEPLRTLIHKVAHHAHKIVDADIAAVRQRRDFRARGVCGHWPGQPAVRHGDGGARGRDGKEGQCVSQSSIAATPFK